MQRPRSQLSREFCTSHQMPSSAWKLSRRGTFQKQPSTCHFGLREMKQWLFSQASRLEGELHDPGLPDNIHSLINLSLELTAGRWGLQTAVGSCHYASWETEIHTLEIAPSSPTVLTSCSAVQRSKKWYLRPRTARLSCMEGTGAHSVMRWWYWEPHRRQDHVEHICCRLLAWVNLWEAVCFNHFLQVSSLPHRIDVQLDSIDLETIGDRYVTICDDHRSSH